MTILRALSLLLLLLAFPLHSAEPPPVIYVMDFDTSQAKIHLGPNQTVTDIFTGVAAMTLSNELVKRLTRDIAPAKRITQLKEAKAPGWLIVGSFQNITRIDNITVTGYYKMEVTAVLSDLSVPNKTLGTYPATSTYYEGNESNEEAEEGGVETTPVPSPQTTSVEDQLVKGITTDTTRAANRIVQQIKKWLSGK